VDTFRHLPRSLSAIRLLDNWENWSVSVCCVETIVMGFSAARVRLWLGSRYRVLKEIVF